MALLEGRKTGEPGHLYSLQYLLYTEATTIIHILNNLELHLHTFLTDKTAMND